MIWGWLVSRIIQPFLPWIMGGLVALSLSGAVFAYLKGRADATAKCREAELRAELVALKRDIEAWKAANYMDRLLQDELEKERRQLEKKVSEYETELAKRPDNRCLLDQRDVDSLRLNWQR